MKKYTTPAALVHWITVILVLILFISGFISSSLDSSDKDADIIQSHIFIGIFVLMISFYRWILLFKDKRPEELHTINNAHKLLKKFTHYFIYVLLIATPLIGFIMLNKSGVDLEIIETQPQLIFNDKITELHSYHKLLAYTLGGFVIIHLLGIIFHYLRRKENPITRMIPEDKKADN